MSSKLWACWKILYLVLRLLKLTSSVILMGQVYGFTCGIKQYHVYPFPKGMPSILSPCKNPVKLIKIHHIVTVPVFLYILLLLLLCFAFCFSIRRCQWIRSPLQNIICQESRGKVEGKRSHNNCIISLIKNTNDKEQKN